MEALTPNRQLPERPPTMFTCATCGNTTVYGAPHEHRFTARARRQREKFRRKLAVDEARRRQPHICEDCDKPMEPYGHLCPGPRVDRALQQAQAAGQAARIATLAADLERAGYVVTRAEPTQPL